MDIIKYVKSFPVYRFNKDEQLLSAGDINENIYAVREGFVKVQSVDEAGNQKLLWVAGRYDIIPLERFFSIKPVSFFYTAVGNGSAFIIPKKELLEQLPKNPNVMREVAAGLSEHYDDLLHRMNAIEQSVVRSKLVYVLHNLASKFSSANVVHFHDLGLNLRHQDIADMVGVTRESVSNELKALQAEGYISYSRSRFTVNKGALEPMVAH